MTAYEIAHSEIFKQWFVKSYRAEAFKIYPATHPSDFHGYTPKNNKLFTYPYCYSAFTPSYGNQSIFRFEDFPNYQPEFRVISELNPNPTVVFLPYNYKNSDGINTQDKVEISGYPTLAWVQDYFNTWLAQNSKAFNLNINQATFNYDSDVSKRWVKATSEAIGQIANLDIAGGIGNAVNTSLDLQRLDVNHQYFVASQMAQMEKQELIPNKGTMGSSNATIMGYNAEYLNVFTCYMLTKEFAKQIDNYFSMYGYQTNEVKIPNTNNRPNWNYVKTINVNIKSSIPQTDLLTLMNMFNQGVTLWHNPNTFRDYSQNNK